MAPATRTWSNIKTFTNSKVGQFTRKTLLHTVYQAFEKYGGNSHYNDSGIGWLLWLLLWYKITKGWEWLTGDWKPTMKARKLPWSLRDSFPAVGKQRKLKNRIVLIIRVSKIQRMFSSSLRPVCHNKVKALIGEEQDLDTLDGELTIDAPENL